MTEATKPTAPAGNNQTQAKPAAETKEAAAATTAEQKPPAAGEQVETHPKDAGRPAEVEGAKKGTYYVKAGQEHTYIQDGDLKVAKEGDPVELTEAQFTSFSDKFTKNKSEAVASGTEG